MYTGPENVGQEEKVTMACYVNNTLINSLLRGSLEFLS